MAVRDAAGPACDQKISCAHQPVHFFVKPTTWFRNLHVAARSLSR